MTDRFEDDDREEIRAKRVQVDLGGLLSGVADLVVQLGGLAGAAHDRNAEQGADGRRSVFGISVRTETGRAGRVEHFGNVRATPETGEAVVEDDYEPIVDVFEEEDGILLVAEMPGVSTEDLKVDAEERSVTFSAARGTRRYRKQVSLPARIDPANIRASGRNGVFEIRCPRAAAAGDGG